MLPTVGLPGDYFHSPMQLQGEWGPYTEQFAPLTRRVVARMKQQQLISPNETVFCTCTKCVLTETDTADNTLLDILRGRKKFGVTKLVIETNFGDGIVGELFRKHLVQTKQLIDIEEVRANVRKEDRIIDSLNLFQSASSYCRSRCH